MQTRTQHRHQRRIEAAVEQVLARLDEPIEPATLADAVGLSRFYFHRVFQALTGETLGDLTRRLRLERAACTLRTAQEPVTRIALEAGYTTPSAFVRAFRQAFGCAPTVFRRRLSYSGHLPTPNGVHFGDPPSGSLRFVASPGELTMQIEVQQLPSRRAACLSHVGPYYMIGQAFGALAAWRQDRDAALGRDVAIFYDDADSTPAEALRSDAGAFVEGELVLDDPRVHLVEIPGGLYAVAAHIGPYDGLPAAWNELVSRWLPGSGHEPAEGPCFEVYALTCNEVPAEQARTELHLPVRPI